MAAAAIAGNSVASASRQSGNRTPNRSAARVPSKREFNGLRAGVGYPLVGIDSTRSTASGQPAARQAKDLQGEAVPTGLARARQVDSSADIAKVFDRPPRRLFENLRRGGRDAGGRRRRADLVVDHAQLGALFA